jgi:carboxypeptidase family protein
MAYAARKIGRPMPRPSLRTAVALVVVVSAAACAGPPPPTDAAKRLAQNPKAVVLGRVTDEEGRPVAGVRVQAIPGGRDVFWREPATTDADGRFRLALDAPAEYVFLVYEGATAVLTDDPRDPARVCVSLLPGQQREGIELTLLRKKRKEISQ